MVCFFFRFLLFFVHPVASSISSGLKAQTWSPWSPHHQSLYNQTKIKTTTTNKSQSNLNHWTTTQPIRRASMTSSKSADENYVSHSGKKPFKRTNTFDTEFLSMTLKNVVPTTTSCDTDNSSSSSVEKSASLENVSTHSNPF